MLEAIEQFAQAHQPRPRLGHIGKEYAARLRLFRGGWQWQNQLQYRFS